MREDKAYLLDLIAKRYPGTRPSDLYGRKSPDNLDGLDDYQAFEFDAATAYRYDALEQEAQQEQLSFIMNGIRAIMRTMGNTQAKPETYMKKLGRTSEKDQQQTIERFFGMNTSGRGDTRVP